MWLCNAGSVMNAHLRQMNTNQSGPTTNWQRAHSGDTAGWRNQLKSMYSEMSIIDKKTHAGQTLKAWPVPH